MEWIEAHGLQPRGAWFGRKPDQPTALPEGVCAFAQEMASVARAHVEAAVVFTTACDQMRRAADAVAAEASSRQFIFNLPATWQSPAARRLYHAEMTRLGKFLEKLGGQAPTAERLVAVIRDYEARRAALRHFIQHHSARQAAEAVRGYFGFGNSLGQEPSERGGGLAGVPLAIVGGPLLPWQWPLFDAIESAGGSVVLNATEPGERTLLPPLPQPSARSPLEALADHYCEHAVDVFHRPNSRLYEWLGTRLTERRVRGIVLWIHVGCDLWRAEAASFREAFGLPVLVLDTHEVHAGGLRDSNRLAAFIESLQ